MRNWNARASEGTPPDGTAPLPSPAPDRGDAGGDRLLARMRAGLDRWFATTSALLAGEASARYHQLVAGRDLHDPRAVAGLPLAELLAVTDDLEAALQHDARVARELAGLGGELLAMRTEFESRHGPLRDADLDLSMRLARVEDDRRGGWEPPRPKQLTSPSRTFSRAA